MKKIIPFLLMGILFFGVSSCKPGSDKKKITAQENTGDSQFPPPADKVQTTNNPYSDFDITAPDSWEKKDTNYMGNRTVIIFSPLEGATDDFRENLNVLTEKTNMAAEDYFALSRKNIAQMLTELEELDNGTAEINGEKSHWLKYNHTYQGIPLQVKTYVIMKNGTAYIITCTSKKGEMDKWDQQFEQIVNTFRIS